MNQIMTPNELEIGLEEVGITLIAPKPLLQERFGKSGISLPEPFRESLLPFLSLGAISRSIHNQGNTNPFPATKELWKQTEKLHIVTNEFRTINALRKPQLNTQGNRILTVLPHLKKALDILENKKLLV